MSNISFLVWLNIKCELKCNLHYMFRFWLCTYRISWLITLLILERDLSKILRVLRIYGRSIRQFWKVALKRKWIDSFFIPFTLFTSIKSGKKRHICVLPVKVNSLFLKRAEIFPTQYLVFLKCCVHVGNHKRIQDKARLALEDYANELPFSNWKASHSVLVRKHDFE